MAKTSSSKSSSKTSTSKASSSKSYTKGSTGYDSKGNRVSANSKSAVSFGNVKGGSTSSSSAPSSAASPSSFSPAPAPAPAIGQAAAQPSSYQIQSGDTLGGIASRYGTDVQSLMAQNPSISNPNMIRAGASLNIGPMGVPPKAQQTVSGDAMANANPYNLPGTVSTPTATDKLLAGLPEATTATTENAAPVDANQSSLDYIKSLMDTQATKGERTEEIYNEEAVFKKEKNKVETHQKYERLKREADLVMRDFEASPYQGTKSGQDRDRNTLKYEYGLKLADAAMEDAFAQENYALAYDIAEKRVAAEFDPLQNLIDNTFKFIEFNRDNLTKREEFELTQQANEQQAEADYGRQIKLLDYKAKIDEAAAVSAAGRAGSGGIGGYNSKVTEGQRNAAIYATRMDEANVVIDELEAVGSAAAGYLESKFPNIAKSADRQKLEQAQRNFINSSLRRESGAAISPDEFNSAAKQYFPQPGDSAAVIAQKRANRLTQTAGLAAAAGPDALSNLELFRTPEVPMVSVSDEEALAAGASLGVALPKPGTDDVWAGFKSFLGF